MAAKRADYFGLWFMPETTRGVDPGIVAADSVNGTDEAVKLQPDANHKAFARLKEKPSGMPKWPLVEVPQVFTTHNFATCKIKGIQEPGDVTFSFVMHGGIKDYGTTGDTGLLSPPPWLRLAGSSLGQLLHGEDDNEVASATNGYNFVLDSAAADDDPGRVLAIDGPGTSNLFEIVRTTNWGSATNPDDADYFGAKFGFSATPADEDKVHFATQVSCDQRFEGEYETFTMLLQRPEEKATIKFYGARATSWEISSTVGEIPTINITFTYIGYEYVNTPMLPEPEYYENLWPCAAVTQGAQVTITWDNNSNGVVDAADVKRDLEVQNFAARWNAGLTRRKASTAPNGIADISPTQPQMFEVDITCVYLQEFQDLIGICCSEEFGNITLNYWETYGNYVRESDTVTRPGAWFVCLPACHQKEDPGTDGEVDNLMYQTIMLEASDWQGDTGDFDPEKHVDTLFLLGVV